jgi:hypothetical protein
MTQSVAPRLPQDRFTLPGHITSPDSIPASPRVTGRARPMTHPAGRGWVALSRDLGIPAEHGVADPVAALGHGAVFTRERRIRFLDHLAFQGNVRAAALRVGVSHETAYRARRQDAGFAALWDAAMVHARDYAEQVLATRALDGVEVPVVYHGEVLAYEVRHDPRFLLAHLARLDRRVEEDERSVERAGRFDELLAAYAGHPEPEDFAEAEEEEGRWREDGARADVPPTRRDYIVWRRSEEIGGTCVEDEARRMDRAARAAAEEWDAWHLGALATVSAIVEVAEVEPERAPVGEGVAEDFPDAMSVSQVSTCHHAKRASGPQKDRANGHLRNGGDIVTSLPSGVTPGSTSPPLS